MNSVSRLLYVPGEVSSFRQLLPNPLLASIVGSLTEAGHSSEIWDYGTVATLARYCPEGESVRLDSVRNAPGTRGVAGWWDRALQFWNPRPPGCTNPVVQAQVLNEITNRLAAVRGLGFVVLALDSANTCRTARKVAEGLKQRRPEICVFAVGDFVEVLAQSAPEHWAPFDGLCVGDCELSLIDLAACLKRRTAWRSISNLVFRRGDRVVHTPQEYLSNWSTWPFPSYDPGLYPALQGMQKFHFFAVEEQRARSYRGKQQTSTDGMAPWSNVKPPERIAEEMRRLSDSCGVYCCRLHGSTASMAHVHGLANHLLARGVHVLHSRGCDAPILDQAALERLAKSGCDTVTFHVESGSQRLLEDFYARSFGISQVETVLRASRDAGLFTVIHLTYPCPQDDRHTKAETLRLLERTRPHAAVVSVPEFRLGLVWSRNLPSQRSGFESCPRHRGSHWFAPRGHGVNAYLRSSRRGEARAADQARQAQEALLLEIEDRGILTCFSEEAILAARAGGYVGREGQFLRMLQTCDASELAALAGEFNDRICSPASRPGWHPYVPMRAAAGN
ncbi:MAG: hypothetical protein HY706_10550 [Candidatus Hydrogenedentes bacterium]|nr:hypothetical protein [Candidatus Hydrogenedentota bacterium]